MMERRERIAAFWDAVARQDRAALRLFFHPEAVVCWHNTNEQFTAEEYIRANCEYPGDWRGAVERVEEAGETAVSVARVWLADGSASFHAVSFFSFTGDRIARLDEYWGDDGEAPAWRKELQLGQPITKRQ